MTGMCSGKRGKVQIGDVIIADFTFPIDLNSIYDMSGDVKRDIQGVRVLNRVIQTVNHFLATPRTLKTFTERPKNSLRLRKEKILKYLNENDETKLADIQDIFDSSNELFNSAVKQLTSVWVRKGENGKLRNTSNTLILTNGNSVQQGDLMSNIVWKIFRNGQSGILCEALSMLVPLHQHQEREVICHDTGVSLRKWLETS